MLSFKHFSLRLKIKIILTSIKIHLLYLIATPLVVFKCFCVYATKGIVDSYKSYRRSKIDTELLNVYESSLARDINYKRLNRFFSAYICISTKCETCDRLIQVSFLKDKTYSLKELKDFKDNDTFLAQCDDCINKQVKLDRFNFLELLKSAFKHSTTFQH